MISNLENSPEKVKFPTGSRVYTKGTYISGIVLCTYRRSSGHIFCVVEVERNLTYIINQDKLYPHKIAPSLKWERQSQTYKYTFD